MSLITKPTPRNCGWNKSWPKASFQRVFSPPFSHLWLPGCCTTSPGSLRDCSHPQLLQLPAQPPQVRSLAPNVTSGKAGGAPPAPPSEAGDNPKVATILGCLVGLSPLKKDLRFQLSSSPLNSMVKWKSKKISTGQNPSDDISLAQKLHTHPPHHPKTRRALSFRIYLTAWICVTIST